jgi:hypothetical protein
MERVLSVVGQVCLGLALFCALALTSGGCGRPACVNGNGATKCITSQFGDCGNASEKLCDQQNLQCRCRVGTGGCICTNLGGGGNQ